MIDFLQFDLDRNRRSVPPQIGIHIRSYLLIPSIKDKVDNRMDVDLSSVESDQTRTKGFSFQFWFLFIYCPVLSLVYFLNNPKIMFFVQGTSTIHLVIFPSRIVACFILLFNICFSQLKLNACMQNKRHLYVAMTLFIITILHINTIPSHQTVVFKYANALLIF